MPSFLLSKVTFICESDKKEAEKEGLKEKSDVKENEDGLEKKKKEKKKKKKEKKKEKKKKKKINNEQIQDDEENVNGSELRNPSYEGNNSEEVDFWIPPSGERWDFDDGAERWGSDSDSDSDSGPEKEDASGTGTFLTTELLIEYDLLIMVLNIM